MATILVVDDEVGIRELLSEILGDEGHVVLLADNAAQARRVRETEDLDLILLDIWMPDTDGVTLLKEWVSKNLLTMPVIMMSGHATIDTAVEATRIGALDFLEKPISMQKLMAAVEKGLARGKMVQSARVLMQTQAPNTVQAFEQAAGLRPGHSNQHPNSAANSVNQARSFASGGFGPGNFGTGFGAASQPMGQAGLGQAALAGSKPARPVQAETPLSIALEELSALDLNTQLRDARDAFERIYFEYHLRIENGSMTRLAERTGIERTHLYRKLKQLGVEVGRSMRRGGL